MKQFFITGLAGLLLATMGGAYVWAGAPGGSHFFQLLTSHPTGGDNTGDGGTGNAADFNYYYVGQAFTATMQIGSTGTTAANIIVDYNADSENYMSASTLSNGNYFPTYSGASIGSGLVQLTGFRTAGQSTGTGTFGTVRFTMLRPTSASLTTTSPRTIDIVSHPLGGSGQSNIALNGIDQQDSEEDFQLHIWADITRPYASTPLPAHGANNVTVESNYTYRLCDTKNGEAGDGGTCPDPVPNNNVGTGINTAPGSTTFDDGSGAVAQTVAFSCSGLWGTNLCNATINPTSPLGIPGDLRNWEYDTAYTVAIAGYQDLASSNQDHLAEGNGPNTINAKAYTFVTEADGDAPFVQTETPLRASGGNSVSTNIVVDIVDRKGDRNAPQNISGTGVVSATCRINVSSPSVPLTTYQEGDAAVTVAGISYGVRFTIDPPVDFAQNELVSVAVYDCQDVAGNVMATDNYTFLTADSSPPFVDQRLPADDDTIAANETITFHIKDTGVGVNLANTVIFVNGTYYTSGGVAGVVPGTNIVFGSSVDFSTGGNSATDVNGDGRDYAFAIKPATAFAAGEAVPIVIYSEDLDGNRMVRDIYSVSVAGAAVIAPVVGSPGVAGGGAAGGGGAATGGAGTEFHGTAEISPPPATQIIPTTEVIYVTASGPSIQSGYYLIDSIHRGITAAGETIVLVVNGQQFSVSISSIVDANTVILDLPGMPGITLKRNIPYELDINQDGTNDIIVTFQGVDQSLQKALLHIQLVQRIDEHAFKRIFTMDQQFIGQLAIGDTIRFTANGQEHSIAVIQIDNLDTGGILTLEIGSEPQIFFLRSGEGISVDLNGDNDDDVTVMLRGIRTDVSLADLDIRRIQKPGAVPGTQPAGIRSITLPDEPPLQFRGAADAEEVAPLKLVGASTLHAVLLGSIIASLVLLLLLAIYQQIFCLRFAKYDERVNIFLHAALIAALILGMTWVAVYSLNTLPLRTAIIPSLGSLSGQVVGLDRQGVAGTDLTAGNVSLRTSESGQFAFHQVPLREGIKIAHPGLSRSFRFMGIKDLIIFDLDLYNFVAESVTRQPMLDQEIFIGDISPISNNVVEVVLMDNNNPVMYRLEKKNGRWSLLP